MPQVFRKVIGALNQLGDVDTMEEIREKLPEQLKNQAWYTESARILLPQCWARREING